MWQLFDKIHPNRNVITLVLNNCIDRMCESSCGERLRGSAREEPEEGGGCWGLRASLHQGPALSSSPGAGRTSFYQKNRIWQSYDENLEAQLSIYL